MSGRPPAGTADRRTIWLASWPRSGNTFLRAVLYHCFGLPSTSVYGAFDLGRNTSLERYAGHFNPDRPPPELTPDMPLLVKTHRRPPDAAPAIYVVRDARAATVSLWEFAGRRYPLRAVIRGYTRYGTWTAHLAAWRPWERPDTLLLRYEDMVDDLSAVLHRISRFLAVPVLAEETPRREEIAAMDGRWVRQGSDWRSKIQARELRLIQAVNGEMLAMLGYEECHAPTGPRGPLRRVLRRAAEAATVPADWSVAMRWRLQAALRRYTRR